MLRFAQFTGIVHQHTRGVASPAELELLLYTCEALGVEVVED